MRVSLLWQLTLAVLIINGCTHDAGLILNKSSKKLPEKCLETSTKTTPPAEESKSQKESIDSSGGAITTESSLPSTNTPDTTTTTTTTTGVIAPRSNVTEAVIPSPNISRFLDNNSFVLRWNILGPFSFDPDDPENYKNTNFNKGVHHTFIPDEKMLDGNQAPPTGTSWQLVRFMPKDSPGQINLAQLFDNQSKCAAAYAITYLYCEKPENSLTLYTGGTGFLKVWINQRLVHTYDREPREGKWDQDVVQGIKLNKGYNLVVVKTVTSGNHWDFFFRLATEDNVPLKFLPR